MGWKGTVREMEAADRRWQRDAQKRQKELERRAKEQAKLSALEQAELEVETFENKIDVLLSVYKECGKDWDWLQLASALPPAYPQKSSYNEFKAKQSIAVSFLENKPLLDATVDQARLKDESTSLETLQVYKAELAECEKLRDLAVRILAQEPKAYMQALAEYSPLREISDLGSSLHFTVHDARLIECSITVDNKQTVPTHIKALTQNDKLSTKPMPKSRFFEIYQDYVCGCLIRVAREIFAMLPVDVLLITASTELTNFDTKSPSEQPILSAIISRDILSKIDFDDTEAFHALESFPYRGDFKSARKTIMFQPIIPLTPSDIDNQNIKDMSFSELLVRVTQVREGIDLRMNQLKQQLTAIKID